MAIMMYYPMLPMGMFTDCSSDADLDRARKELKTRLKGITNEEQRRKIKNEIYDSIDKRRICVVTAETEVGGGVRQIFRVTEDAENRMDELKKAYYSICDRLDTDEFHFFTGLHNAQKWADEHIEEHYKNEETVER